MEATFSKENTSDCSNEQLSNIKDQNKSLGLELLEAARNGKIDRIVGLICKGAPFLSDILGASPLHWAVYNSCSNLTELLLNSGIDCDLRNKANRTPLHLAAQCGHSSIIQTLLSYGADPSSLDLLEMTPLHWAAESGDIESVKCLIACGTQSRRNKFGKSPLDIAKSKGFEEIINLIKNVSQRSPTDLKVSDNLTNDIIFKKTNETDASQTMDEKLKFSHFKPTKNGKTHQSKRRRTTYLDDSEESDSSDESCATNLMDLSTLNLLREHGIQMIEPDEDKDSLVASAIKSGQEIVLTEAGKLALGTVSINHIINEDHENPEENQRVLQNGKRSFDCLSENVYILPKKKPALKKVLINDHSHKLVKGNISKIKLLQNRSHMTNHNKDPAIIESHEVHIFEGKTYSKFEEPLLVEKMKRQIAECQHQANLLEICSKKKIQEAHSLRKQLLAFLKKTGRSLNNGKV